eukprot:TRINITY_DN4952_c0_g1_i1.p1 TRINITY_DN4952_c0_g1~~TRINITY_DN4952_c0_g1_i1.p1  ORF type:complete len:260 (+),score=90.90 TRINITY_DN4952_c0_g1_i1:36-815(+)
MSGSLQELKIEDVEAAVKERQSTPGGMKLNIVLSPAVKSIPKSASASPSPVTRAGIEEKLSAAAARREQLDNLKAKNITAELAKVVSAKSKKEELVVEKSTKSKEMIETKMETQEKNRQELMEKNKEKVVESLAKVEKAQRELEIQMEAARLSAECALNAKLTKAQENRDEHMVEIVKKIKEHEQYVAEVRSSQDKLFSQQEKEIEAQLNVKLEKAAKERERKEQELKEKLEERNRKAEIVRKNKEKIALQGDVGPQSA